MRIGAPPPLDRRAVLGLAGVLVVAAVLRVGWAAYAARTPGVLSDPAFYLFHGSRISLGLGYTFFDGPTAYYPIGYPAALGGVLWVAQHTPLPDWPAGVAAGLNTVVGVATVGLVFEAGRRALGDLRSALVGAGVVAVLPALVLHAGVALTESLFSCLVAAFVVVALGSGEERRRAVALGVVAGLASYVRPIGALLLVVVLVVWWRSEGSIGRALRRTGLVLAATVLVLLPWTVRNAVVMDSFVLLSTNTGDNVCMSRQPGTNGAFQLTDYCFGGYDRFPRPESELRRDREGVSKGLRFVRERPLEEVELWFRRTGHTFSGGHDALLAAEGFGRERFMDPGRRELLVTAADLSFWAVLALGTVGLVLGVNRRRRDPGPLLLALVPLALFLPVVVFFGDMRFAVPLLPWLALGVGALCGRAPAREPVERPQCAP